MGGVSFKLMKLGLNISLRINIGYGVMVSCMGEVDLNIIPPKVGMGL